MTDVLHALVAAIPVLGALWLLVALFITLAMPFLFLSIVRNIARIRRALERMADGADPGRRAQPGSILGA